MSVSEYVECDLLVPTDVSLGYLGYRHCLRMVYSLLESVSADESCYISLFESVVNSKECVLAMRKGSNIKTWELSFSTKRFEIPLLLTSESRGLIVVVFSELEPSRGRLGLRVSAVQLDGAMLDVELLLKAEPLRLCRVGNSGFAVLCGDMSIALYKEFPELNHVNYYIYGESIITRLLATPGPQVLGLSSIADHVIILFPNTIHIYPESIEPVQLGSVCNSSSRIFPISFSRALISGVESIMLFTFSLIAPTLTNLCKSPVPIDRIQDICLTAKDELYLLTHSPCELLHLKNNTWSIFHQSSPSLTVESSALLNQEFFNPNLLLRNRLLSYDVILQALYNIDPDSYSQSWKTYSGLSKYLQTFSQWDKLLGECISVSKETHDTSFSISRWYESVESPLVVLTGWGIRFFRQPDWSELSLSGDQIPQSLSGIEDLIDFFDGHLESVDRDIVLEFCSICDEESSHPRFLERARKIVQKYIFGTVSENDVSILDMRLVSGVITQVLEHSSLVYDDEVDCNDVVPFGVSQYIRDVVICRFEVLKRCLFVLLYHLCIEEAPSSSMVTHGRSSALVVLDPNMENVLIRDLKAYSIANYICNRRDGVLLDDCITRFGIYDIDVLLPSFPLQNITCLFNIMYSCICINDYVGVLELLWRMDTYDYRLDHFVGISKLYLGKGLEAFECFMNMIEYFKESNDQEFYKDYVNSMYPWDSSVPACERYQFFLVSLLETAHREDLALQISCKFDSMAEKSIRYCCLLGRYEDGYQLVRRFPENIHSFVKEVCAAGDYTVLAEQDWGLLDGLIIQSLRGLCRSNIPFVEYYTALYLFFMHREDYKQASEVYVELFFHLEKAGKELNHRVGYLLAGLNALELSSVKRIQVWNSSNRTIVLFTEHDLRAFYMFIDACTISSSQLDTIDDVVKEYLERGLVYELILFSRCVPDLVDVSKVAHFVVVVYIQARENDMDVLEVFISNIKHHSKYFKFLLVLVESFLKLGKDVPGFLQASAVYDTERGVLLLGNVVQLLHLLVLYKKYEEAGLLILEYLKDCNEDSWIPEKHVYDVLSGIQQLIGLGGEEIHNMTSLISLRDDIVKSIPEKL